MRCAKCSGKTKIVDTRKWHDHQLGFYWTERKHVCRTCDNVFVTIEILKTLWDQYLEANP